MPNNPVQLTRSRDTRLVVLGSVKVIILHTEEYAAGNKCRLYPAIECLQDIEEVRFMVDTVLFVHPSGIKECRIVYYIKEILIGSTYRITYQTLESPDGPYRVAIVKLLEKE